MITAAMILNIVMTSFANVHVKGLLTQLPQSIIRDSLSSECPVCSFICDISPVMNIRLFNVYDNYRYLIKCPKFRSLP